MLNSISETTSEVSAAEYFRLSLAKLGELQLPTTPVNYALVYYYVSGEDIELNDQLDKMFANTANWSEQQASDLFSQYVCPIVGGESMVLEQELLLMVAQVLGMVVDLTGKSAVSSESLESHLEQLASSNKPENVLSIASSIIAETRLFVSETKKFESSLRQTTVEIEQLKDKLDHARKQAKVDSLTSLHNRRGFDAALKEAIETHKIGQHDFCLLILDIDYFKEVNDNHGHLVGDKVLIGIAKQLLNQMRGNDYLSRFGGEEFAILLFGTPLTSAFTVAEKLRRTVGLLRLKHTATGQKIGKVTISIGVACYRPNESGENLIQRCDQALYRAKSLGRDRSVIAD